LEYR
jgi:glmM: phosphoglucosamine mutase